MSISLIKKMFSKWFLWNNARKAIYYMAGCFSHKKNLRRKSHHIITYPFLIQWRKDNFAPDHWYKALNSLRQSDTHMHDDVIKWKHFPHCWPFVQGIHRSPVNSPHKGQWRGALMFSLICVWINGWVNNGEAGDLRRYHTHYDVTVMDMDQ